MTDAIRDRNHIPVALGVSSTDSTTTLPLKIDSSTGKLLADMNNVTSGTYAITFTNVANLDSTPASTTGTYLRVGNTVTVSGTVTVDPTAATTATRVGISLPVASNFSGVSQCGGTAFASGVAGQGAAIFADATNDRAEMRWVSGDTTSQAMYFTFTYQVI